MLTYALTSGVATGFDYNNPPKGYGAWIDSGNLKIREYSDLFTTSNLTQAPAITTLYTGAGLSVGSKFLGGTWHNYPNTSSSAIRTNLAGITMNDMGFNITTARSHDYYPNSGGSTQWLFLEQSQDSMFYTNLDKFVNDHYAAGRDIILVLGFSPDWVSSASAPAGDSIYSGASYLGGTKSANPPDSMTDWSDFCTKVATQCNGKVKYYEIWNEPDNSVRWWNGTSTQYAQMLRRANQAIKAVDATAKILCPGLSSIGSAGRTWLSNMFAASDGASGTGATGAGAEKWTDIFSIHQYYSGTSNYSTFISDLASLKTLLNSNGYGSSEIWLTECGVNSVHGIKTTPGQRLKYMLRMIYLAATQSIARVQFYSMDSTTLSPMYYTSDILSIRTEVHRHVNHLIAGEVTLVNMLTDGTLAVTANGTNYLI